MVLRVVLIDRNLGVDDIYFQEEAVETIAQHILGLYAAKMNSFMKNDHSLDIHLERETSQGAVYIHTSKPGVSNVDGPKYEEQMDLKYLDQSSVEDGSCFRLESYRSAGTVSSTHDTTLRCYFLHKCDFLNPKPTEEQKFDIRAVSDKSFAEKANEHTLQVYEKIMRSALGRNGPVIEVFDVQGSREKRLVIALKQKTTTSFFSAMSDLYHYYDLYTTRKYVEQFSNGITIYCFYLHQIPNSKSPPIEISAYQIIKEASLLYCLPTTPFQYFFQLGKLSVQEAIYGYSGWIFCQHFLNRLGSEYTSLASILDSTNMRHVEVLSKIKKRLRSDTFTREYILDIVKLYPDLVKALYNHFAMTHHVSSQSVALQPSLSVMRLQNTPVLNEVQLKEEIRKTVQNAHELMIFECYLMFNNHILKTNFYQPTKVAISFRLDPKFLPEVEYPIKPFGLFLVVGSEFRGFHIRFRDIARGGIRVVRSRNKESYSINLRSLLDENYGLAATQQRKNKDIPEGGSKGTILLDFANQDKARVAFEKYVDSILDLLIVGETPGIKEKIVDLYDKPEILFFGPDEGTADMMDW